MTSPLAITQKKPLIIGKTYLIECVRCSPFGNSIKLWLPLFGTIHADDEDTGAMKEIVDRYHIHIDMRFITSEEMDLMNFHEWTQGALSICPKFGYKRNDPIAKRIMSKISAYSLVTKRETRKCLRQWNNLPPSKSAGRRRFEKKFSKHKIDVRNPVCPHQGLDLSQIEPDCNGMIVCPGHVLGWCNKTGKLIPRERGKL